MNARHICILFSLNIQQFSSMWETRYRFITSDNYFPVTVRRHINLWTMWVDLRSHSIEFTCLELVEILMNIFHNAYLYLFLDITTQSDYLIRGEIFATIRDRCTFTDALVMVLNLFFSHICSALITYAHAFRTLC